MISFSCSACGKGLKAKDELAGRRVKCACGKVVEVPAGVGVKPERTTRPRPEAPDTRGAEEDDFGAYQLAADSVPDAANPTGVGPKAGTTESYPKEAWAFLHPPQGPGEIGRLGGYRITKVLGMGGMGVVFKGEDTQLQRPVAIKAMLPEIAGMEQAKQRFIREARAAAKLKHPHIVTIYQVSEDGNVPFLAMEFLQGESLHDRLVREGKLPTSEIVRIGRELAEGLGEAHDKGFIHRDIKPANIWLEGPKGHAKILDFGLAKDASDKAHLTQTGAIIGTPAFMAPEQAAGKKCDHRSDLFSLGSVLYCMATGERPFHGNDPITLLTALAVQDPTPPQDLNSALPDALSDLILQLLEKDPRNRPQSAQELIQGLKKSRGKKQAGSESKRTAISVAVSVLGLLLVVALFRGVFSGGDKAEPNQVASAPKEEEQDKTPATPDKENEASAKPGTPEPGKEQTARPKPAVEPAPDLTKKPTEEDVFAFLKPSTVGRQLTGQEVYDRLLKSVVCVYSDSGRGSGALVNKEERLVVTNHHVVYSPAAGGAVMPGGVPPAFGPGVPGVKVPSGAAVIAGTLDLSSPIDRIRNRRFKLHFLPMSKGDKYSIEMLSNFFDSYLRLEDSQGNNLAQDDDGGGGRNAKIIFTAPKDDNYRIIATSYSATQLGAYTLQITPLALRGLPAGAAERFVSVMFPKVQAGKLLTASADYVREMMANREMYKAKIIYSDETKDLAIVQLASLPAGVEALPLATESAKPGQSVHSVGNPGASDSFWVYTSGTVRTGPSQKAWFSGGSPLMRHNAKIIETQSPTNPGDSGGPLVNEWAELVAVTQGSNVKANAVNIFIDVSEVKAILQSKGYRWATLTKEPENARTSLTTPTVLKLAELLDHDSSKVRAQAAIHLGEGGKQSRDATAALAKSLKDKDAAVRRAAANALGVIGVDSGGALTGLAGTLADPERDVRLEAIKAINKIGPRGSVLATAIGGLLLEGDAELQEQGLAMLAKTGADAKHALTGVKKVIEGGEAKLLKPALTALEQMGPGAREAAPSLEKALAKSDATTRAHIARLLVRWNATGESSKLLISELAKGVKSSDKALCLENLKTLESLGKAAKTAIWDIEYVYRRQKDREIRSQSLKTLAAMGPAAADAVDWLIRDLCDQEFRFNDKAMHDQVRQTLVKIGLPAAQRLVQSLSGNISQRTIALEVIGEIGPEAAAVRPALLKHRETAPEMEKLRKATIEQITR